MLALVLYGEALSHTGQLGPGVRITFVEGRFFVPALGVLLLPFSRTAQVEPQGRLRWAGWTVLAGSAGIAIWSLVWLVGAEL